MSSADPIRILLVEDDAKQARLAQRVLEDAGYTVERITDAKLQAEAPLRRTLQELEDRAQHRTADLQRSEALNRGIVDTAVDGIITIDERGIVASCNPAAERIFGYHASEVIGRNVKMLMPSPYRDEHDRYLAHYLETGERKIIGIGREVMGQRKDGTTFPMELAVGETIVAGQRIFTGIVRDIADRKRSEEALRESQRTLSTLMSNLPGMAYRCYNDRRWTMQFVSQGCLGLTGYRPEELIENRRVSYEQVIHRDDRDAIWSEVQHALKRQEPFQITYRIVTASGMEEWVWEQGREVVSADGNQAIEGFVTDITDRITGLVQQLLTFARAENQSMGAFSLHEPLSHALRLLETRLSREGITVVLKIPAALPLLWGAADQIEQVFLNVLVNAWHAMPDGGTMTIEAHETANQRVCVTFRDSGIGMSAEDLEKSIEPFYSTKGDKGTGLGLAICKQIIDNHHGSMRLASTAGAGTTVTFHFIQADTSD